MAKAKKLNLSKRRPLLMMLPMMVFVAGFAGLVAYSSRNMLTHAAPVTVTGRVYDASNGKGIAGIAVAFCYNHSHVVTDANGNWSKVLEHGSGMCPGPLAPPGYYSGPVLNPSYTGPIENNRYDGQVAGHTVWGMNGYSGYTFGFRPKPPAPTYQLMINDQAGDITVASGSNVTLRWFRTGEGAASCAASGDWSGGKDTAGGAEAVSVGAGPATRTYTLRCSNDGGASSVSRSVHVQAPAPPPSRLPAAPAPPTPASPADTEPPSQPAELTVTQADNSPFVDLAWRASTDNKGVKAYIVERAKDGNDWQTLHGGITETTYTDADIEFGTEYIYRVAAVDEAGNKSSYTTAMIITGDFRANASSTSELRVTSEDGVATYVIPVGALVGEAVCVVEPYVSLGPALENKQVAAGPYELICKDQDGTIITEFEAPLKVTMHISGDKRDGLGKIEYYVESEGNWEPATIASRDEQAGTDTVEVGDKRYIIAMAGAKGSSILPKILIGVLAIVSVVVVASAGLYVLSLLQRRKQQRLYEDYLRKSKGL